MSYTNRIVIFDNMSNLFDRLGSRNKPPSLEALCEKVITAQELEAASGLTILNMRKVLSSLTPDEFQVIGNK